MTAPDDGMYERVTRRIARITMLLGAAGTATAFATGGWKAAAGFALGGTASWFSFRWLKQVVSGLGADRPAPNLALKGIVRYLLIGAGAYVIVKYTVVNLLAALIGLLLSTAAVLVEILIELIYARE